MYLRYFTIISMLATPKVRLATRPEAKTPASLLALNGAGATVDMALNGG